MGFVHCFFHFMLSPAAFTDGEVLYCTDIAFSLKQNEINQVTHVL